MIQVCLYVDRKLKDIIEDADEIPRVGDLAVFDGDGDVVKVSDVLWRYDTPMSPGWFRVDVHMSRSAYPNG